MLGHRRILPAAHYGSVSCPAATEGAPLPDSISLCCVTGGPPGRTAAILQLFREAVSEIVVALDDRVDPRHLGALPEIADRIVRYPYAEPPGRALAWAYSQCRGDWIFQVDDDEIPSQSLLDGLPSLANAALTHVLVPRRWLYPDPEHWLTDAPWTPDRSPRLLRNDPRFLRFPGRRHELLRVEDRHDSPCFRSTTSTASSTHARRGPARPRGTSASGLVYALQVERSMRRTTCRRTARTRDSSPCRKRISF